MTSAIGAASAGTAPSAIAAATGATSQLSITADRTHDRLGLARLLLRIRDRGATVANLRLSLHAQGGRFGVTKPLAEQIESPQCRPAAGDVHAVACGGLRHGQTRSIQLTVRDELVAQLRFQVRTPGHHSTVRYTSGRSL